MAAIPLTHILAVLGKQLTSKSHRVTLQSTVSFSRLIVLAFLISHRLCQIDHPEEEIRKVDVPVWPQSLSTISSHIPPPFDISLQQTYRSLHEIHVTSSTSCIVVIIYRNSTGFRLRRNSSQIACSRLLSINNLCSIAALTNLPNKCHDPRFWDSRCHTARVLRCVHGEKQNGKGSESHEYCYC